MFDFSPPLDLPKPELYRQLAQAAVAITQGEDDPVANMANLAALIWEYVPDLNWAGFYRVLGEELVLGPFIGRPACLRIPFGKGVCGHAAKSGETVLVEDVNSFDGHIACDSQSQSELVIPVNHCNKIHAVIDLDSPTISRFTLEDQEGMEIVANQIAVSICG